MMRDDYDVDRLNTIFVQLIYPRTKAATLDEPLPLNGKDASFSGDHVDHSRAAPLKVLEPEVLIGGLLLSCSSFSMCYLLSWIPFSVAIA